MPAVKKGDVLTVQDLVRSPGGAVLITAEGVSFALRKELPLEPGACVEVGPVCGVWAALFWGEERVQALLLADEAAREGGLQGAAVPQEAAGRGPERGEGG